MSKPRPWTCKQCGTEHPPEVVPLVIERGKTLVKLCPLCLPAYTEARKK